MLAVKEQVYNMLQRLRLLSTLSVLCISLTACKNIAPTLGDDTPHQQTPPQDQPSGSAFNFALIGDLPYRPHLAYQFDNLIHAINQDHSVEWVLHAGDIKPGTSSCSDKALARRLATFQTFNKPFILSLGDNEWTDCHRFLAGSYAPLERLDALRKLFYPQPTQSLGIPMPLDTQAQQAGYEAFVEHAMWQKNDVLFVTLHIVGSLNATVDFKGRSMLDDQEVETRTQAAIAWLEYAASRVRNKQLKGLFIMMHADPLFQVPATDARRQAFNPIIKQLKTVSERLHGTPILLAHGDSHRFVYDQPLKDAQGHTLKNFWRVETFGDKDVDWIKVHVKPETQQVFWIQQEIMHHPLIAR